MLAVKEAGSPVLKGVACVSLFPTMDLSKFVARVRREEVGWTEERLIAAEAAYRQFWLECKHIPHNRPSRDVDKIWHAHILHTKDYARDSQEYFGRYLHHTPDNGGRAELGDCDGCTACSSGCSGGGTVHTACSEGDGPVI